MATQQSKKIAEKSKSDAGKSTGDGPVRVAIQGYEGSFHQVAAWTFFGKSVDIIPCATFREVVKRASIEGPETGGVMAIENSIAGSILPNYNLLQQSQLHITGEVYLQINQNLLVNGTQVIHRLGKPVGHDRQLLNGSANHLERTHAFSLLGPAGKRESLDVAGEPDATGQDDLVHGPGAAHSLRRLTEKRWEIRGHESGSSSSLLLERANLVSELRRFFEVFHLNRFLEAAVKLFEEIGGLALWAQGMGDLSRMTESLMHCL